MATADHSGAATSLQCGKIEAINLRNYQIMTIIISTLQNLKAFGFNLKK